MVVEPQSRIRDSNIGGKQIQFVNVRHAPRRLHHEVGSDMLAQLARNARAQIRSAAG
jgi:hypothetical protein